MAGGYKYTKAEEQLIEDLMLNDYSSESTILALVNAGFPERTKKAIDQKRWLCREKRSAALLRESLQAVEPSVSPAVPTDVNISAPLYIAVNDTLYKRCSSAEIAAMLSRAVPEATTSVRVVDKIASTNTTSGSKPQSQRRSPKYTRRLFDKFEDTILCRESKRGSSIATMIVALKKELGSIRNKNSVQGRLGYIGLPNAPWHD